MPTLAELDIDEKPVAVTEPEKHTTDLQDLLSGYNEAAKVETPVTPVQPTQASTPTPTVNGPSWVGNPLYYQSGKKQGQLKPQRKAGFMQQPVSMNVNPGTSEISGDIISGALFLTIINLLFPMLFSVLNNAVSKKKIAYEDLQIDDKALKNLETLSDKALKHIKIEANPVAVLFITMLGLYALQFMTVKMISDVKPKLHVTK